MIVGERPIAFRKAIPQSGCGARLLGLKEESSLMVDKIITVTKAKLGRRIGQLEDRDVLRLNRAVMVFLGLAGAGSEG